MSSVSPNQLDALRQLQTVVEVLPDGEKSAFLRALEVAPDLVFTESDPLRFLRFTNFNVDPAARSLVLYWQRRLDVFGTTKAFLPLLVMGGANSALSPEIIDEVRTGRLAFLPHDSQGCTVLCGDVSRNAEFDINVRRQALFYRFQIMSENEISQKEGYVFLMILSEFKFDPSQSESLKLLLGAFPVRAKAWHLVSCIPSWNRSCLVQTFVKGLMRLFGHLIRQHNTHFYTSDEKDEILERLKSHGFSREKLPECLGGAWKYEQVSDWLVERKKIERQRYPNAFRAVVDQKTLQNQVTQTTAQDEDSKPPAINSYTGSEEERERQEFFKACESHVTAALQKLPAADTVAYFAAKQIASAEIWAAESDFMPYIRAEHCNAQFAARRLSRYWNLRNECFGSTDIQPLHQTGEGVLRRKELAALATGFVVLLPFDAQGCSVLWLDDTKLQFPKSTRPKNRAELQRRCFFYMFSLMTENEKSQTDGVVLLHNVDSTASDRVDIGYVEFLVHCLPLRGVKSSHVISMSREIPSDVNPDVYFCEEAHFHENVGIDEVIARLEAEGIDKQEGLPSFLEGGFTMGKFIRWQELRTRLEFRIPLAYQGKQTQEAYSFPAIRPYTLLPETERAEQSRRANVVHCRRRRDRQLIEDDMLLEECSRMKNQKRRLQEENQRLEYLVDAASNMADSLETRHSTDACDRAMMLNQAQESNTEQGVSHYRSAQPIAGNDASVQKQTSRSMGLSRASIEQSTTSLPADTGHIASVHQPARSIPGEHAASIHQFTRNVSAGSVAFVHQPASGVSPENDALIQHFARNMPMPTASPHIGADALLDELILQRCIEDRRRALMTESLLHSQLAQDGSFQRNSVNTLVANRLLGSNIAPDRAHLLSALSLPDSGSGLQQTLQEVALPQNHGAVYQHFSFGRESTEGMLLGTSMGGTPLSSIYSQSTNNGGNASSVPASLSGLLGFDVSSLLRRDEGNDGTGTSHGAGGASG